MTSPSLPAELKAALDAKLQGLPRNEAASRAALISKTYRDGGNSRAIKSETDALAYALARMPATYAAVAASLNALSEVRPDFAPQGLLDAGAGPGTASWAAAEAFSSLTSFALLDENPALRSLALELARGSTRLGGLTYDKGEARALLGPIRAGRSRDRELCHRRTRRDRANRACRIAVEQDPRHAPDRRARHARGHPADARVAAAIDRVGRACRGALPA